MEKESYSQLELFSGQAQASTPRPGLSSRCLSFLKGYEKALLIVMGFLITSVVSFSLGVERGRKYAATNNSVLRLDMATKKEPVAAAPGKALPILAAAPAATNKVLAQAPKQVTGGFTVQVASYLKRESAQKEAQFLGKKGVSAAVIPKGKYFILCAGNFSDRRSAEVLLARLKKQYKDCQVRRL